MLTKTFTDLTAFVERRKRLQQSDKNNVFIFFSGREAHLSRFRAQSHFVYLTGFEEPDACAVIRTGTEPSFSLFVRDRDSAVEIWDGERFGVERAKKEFIVDQCFSISDLNKELKNLLRGAETIYFNIGEDSEYDAWVLDARKQALLLDKRSGKSQAAIADPDSVLGKMRVIKDQWEQQWIKEACELSAQAHLHVMQNVRPGMNEVQVQADLLYSFYQQKAFREGYSSIIASGPNATTLHYRANNRDMGDDDFLLIDAGAEKNYYTADITRTYPVSGKFSKPQKALYEAVLRTQKKLIELVQPGFSLIELQEKTCTLLTEQMIELGLLSGKTQQLVEEKSYQKYYPHGVGHYLGMDVHDVGAAKIGDTPVSFKEGMVITVEPGLYIPVDDLSAPKDLRGLGVRIEDDVLIGSKNPKVLTVLAPKEISELESVIGHS